MGIQELLDVIPRGSEERALARSIDDSRLPRHVAIIMDGNGRWARLRRKRRVEGHRAAITAVREAIETSARLGVEILTLYAFSVENWKRPKSEVRTLMGLLKRYIRAELDALVKNGIRVRVLGRLHELPADVRKELERAIARTTKCTGLIFNIALNYGGRTEIVDAVQSIIREALDSRRTFPIDEQTIAAHLYTAGQPDPDLLIRTSGEMRVSNFLLWQIAYSEIWITDVLWPDFRRRHLLQAVADYQKRERRYGGITAS
ncbi:MAG: isoprenyl transferase [Vicinamibacteria bacterium]|nr:isoprenyl transferase [Vicinamibacteria bacterium]